ncbi:MAG: hypothetical protein L6R40_008127 [Gallowayella cf. fulva]|nr:MAG: hypothetical protein L6R40_008127 [Xanthomendoza cf. fulva]
MIQMSSVKASNMEDPNFIATLIPVDDEKRAENAFCHDNNKERYLPPTRGIAEGPTISSREATPAQEQPDDDHCKYDSTHRLQLTFGKEPKNASKGYSFGTDPKNCDILLGNRGAKEGKWEIEVNARKLRFKLELASHKTCKAEYDKEVKKFLKQSSTALPPVDGLGIDSYTTTAQPSQASTPRPLPVYVSERGLGRGSFGRVDRVIDVSTGAIYARKEFYEPQWAKNEERRRQQKEGWLDRVRREIRIMRESSHENIVQVVASRDGPLPFLVMPYLSLGNLENLHSESPITEEETMNVLFQALSALKYLHLRGVAHRDLKPQNILVESRFPLSVKLADFGLANDKPDLETLCGTKLYTAPEVYLGRKYTASIDLWQKRGQHKQSIMEEWGLTWCRRVVNAANDWESDDVLIDLLTTGMLRMRPEERLSTDACLARGYDLKLFHGHSHACGSATPRDTNKQRTLQDENNDDDGSTTILLRALWDTEKISKHDENSRTEYRNTTSAVLDSRSLRSPRSPCSPSNGTGRGSQLGSLGSALDQLGSNGHSSVDLSYPLKAGSTYPGGFKRQRTPAVGSANNSSGRGRIKRRPPGVHLTEVPMSHGLGALDRRLGHDGGSNEFCTTYDAVLSLLHDLLWSKRQAIDDRTSSLIGEVSQCLARLEITGMRLTRDDLYGQAIIATGRDCQEIVLARLTPSELMSSIADLAAHLLHKVQLQNPCQASTPAVPKDDHSRDIINAHDNRSQSPTVHSIDGSMPISIARQYGLN